MPCSRHKIKGRIKLTQSPTCHDLLPASTLLITDKSRTPYIYTQKQYRLKGKDKNNKVKNESTTLQPHIVACLAIWHEKNIVSRRYHEV
jgi:hypothetical protein